MKTAGAQCAWLDPSGANTGGPLALLVLAGACWSSGAYHGIAWRALWPSHDGWHASTPLLAYRHAACSTATVHFPSN